jgi:DNA-binding beta-propeller fold protein YncE
MYRILILFLALMLFPGSRIPGERSPYFSPIDLVLDAELKRLLVAGETACELRAYNLNDFSSYSSCHTKLPPKSICLAGDKLLLACSYAEGSLLVYDKRSLEPLGSIEVGPGASDVEVSQDHSLAYVANQFSDDISVVDLIQMRELERIRVLRQPRQLALSRDGSTLFAANFLPAGRADVDTVTSMVSVIDLRLKRAVKHIPLANGSNALRGMCLSADGLYLLITHNLGRFQLPTTQLEQGWMNTSALSIIDVASREFVATILLDEPDKGAAGSWGIDCSEAYVYVAHSGTHDISTIDYAALMEKLSTHTHKQHLAYDLRFLSDIRERTRIEGNGPRALISSQNKLYVASYFSDKLHVLSREDPKHPDAKIVSLADPTQQDLIRKGEQYFHDADYCFQSWQACTGCHPDNARTDGLNWDLLNDGMGNPKNCKSLVLSHVTAPAMITGIRPDAETAVRAGFEFIQFMQVDDSISSAVDIYLKSLKPVPSPHLVHGRLSPDAKKGKAVFMEAGCAECHPKPYYTDLKSHTIGTQGMYDHQNSWDTPTLLEAWRTAPYLHDGRCATMKEVFTKELHGLDEALPDKQVDRLVAYLLSL